MCRLPSWRIDARNTANSTYQEDHHHIRIRSSFTTTITAHRRPCCFPSSSSSSSSPLVHHVDSVIQDGRLLRLVGLARRHAANDGTGLMYCCIHQLQDHQVRLCYPISSGCRGISIDFTGLPGFHRGDIPSFKLVDTEKTFAFLDIGPLSKGHALVIPKCACSLHRCREAQGASLT